MPSVFKPRRGTAAQHSSFTGISGEVTLDTTNRRWLLHDGSTVGGLTIGGTGSEASNSYVTATFTTNTAFQSALANTNLAISDRMQVANAQALFNTLQANLVSTTNVQTRATWSALIATNTAIRLLVTSNDTDISNLQTEDGNLWSAITATNTAIRSLVTSNDTDISNLQTEDGNLWSAITATNTAIRSITTTNANKISQVESNLLSTNTAIRTLVSDRLQVANATLDNIISTGNTTTRSLSVGGLEISYGGNPYKLPTGDGAASQILQTDGAGQASWVALEQAEGGGFNLGTLTSFPGTDGDADYLEGGTADETYVGSTGASGSDAFGVSLQAVYDMMDPVGRVVTEDLGAFS